MPDSDVPAIIPAGLATFRCPKCGHVEHQLPTVTLVEHRCPKRIRAWQKMVRVEDVEGEA